MTLRQRQSDFARMVPRLIDKAFELGFEVTLGDAFRDPRCLYGRKASFHHLKLAIDLHLFKKGKYLRKTEDHRPLGEWWEDQGGTWGGRFTSPDGNHYSWGEV